MKAEKIRVKWSRQKQKMAIPFKWPDTTTASYVKDFDRLNSFISGGTFINGGYI